MKIRPILFSTLMVRALLAGTKTQTRRIIKPQPIDDTENSGCIFSGDHMHQFRNDMFHADWKERFVAACCPYQVGDVLWVRETWSELVKEHQIDGERFVFRADCKDEDSERCRQDYIRAGYPYHWKPSLFMPAEAARIFLKVTSVRVERLQDISEADSVAEGINKTTVTKACSGSSTEYRYQNYLERHDIHHPMHKWCYAANASYLSLWEKINGKGSSSENPFVWVYEFERIEKPGNFPDVGKIAKKRAKTAESESKIAKNVSALQES